MCSVPGYIFYHYYIIDLVMLEKTWTVCNFVPFPITIYILPVLMGVDYICCT